MIETAIRETNHHLPLTAIDEIIHLGKTMLSKPVTLIEDVEKVLATLAERYKLVVATKGDLLDQERKKKIRIGRLLSPHRNYDRKGRG